MVIVHFTAMLLLLLVCSVRAEWVQISQQHYRKPPDQPHAPYHPLTRPPPPPTTEPAWTNHTLPRWKPATVQRIAHMGTIKRVHVEHVPDKQHKPTRTEDNDTLSLSLNKLDFITNDDSDQRAVTEITSITTRKPSAVHEAVSIKRNPFLTVVRKQTTTTESSIENVFHEEQTIPYKNTNRVYIGGGGSMEKLTVNKHDIHQEYLTEHDHGVVFKKYDVTENIDVPFVTKQNTLNDDENSSVNSKQNETKSVHKSEDHKKRPVENKVNVKEKDNIRNPAAHESENVETSVNTTNMNTIDNVLKILKVVADTISRNTKSSFQSKIKYLHNLKNTILANIEVRMGSLWRDGARRSRSLQPAARGHVDFPSSESALMTISFLTFAVFLIKLVLQVIQKYKNNSMMMTPALVATVRRLHNAPAHPTTDPTFTYD